MGAESLQAACELAFVVAREDAESAHEVEPPASLRSFLYVSDLPRRAVSLAQQAIENDSEFRKRVAAQASEDSVGRAGYLWLHRPSGWAQEFEELTAGDDDDDEYYEAAEEAPAPELPEDESQPPPPQAWHATGYEGDIGAPNPDPEVEEVYNDLMSAPVELVSAQPPEPTDTDPGIEPDDTFSPDSPPISDAPMASVSLIGGNRDGDPPPPSFELASIGTAAVADQIEYDVDESNFSAFSEDGPPTEGGESDFEADALENELSSLRGLVDRLAGEREMVVSSMPPEQPAALPVDTVGGRELENEIMALESDLETARHELTMAQADLSSARHDREEAQRLQSQALKRQVDLEKELASVREQRVEVENQASEAQVAAISLEDKLARIQTQFEEAERERNVVKSQLETMTSERNQIREDRVALKSERDDLAKRMQDVEEKSGGVDVGELSLANRSMTTELESTGRELARVTARAESLEEQVRSATADADSLKTSNIELTSRLGDTELALETTTTQHEALKVDSERLAAEVGTLRAERDALQTQLTDLQASLADVLAEQAESRQRNDSDRQELNELRIERDVQMARMADLEQADRDYENRIKVLVTERDDLLTARDDLINERGQLRGEAAAATAEREQLLDKIASVEGQIGPLETELQAERRQREELANRLLELDDIAAQNAAELSALTEERQAMASSLEELQSERILVGDIQAERDSFANQLAEVERMRLEELERAEVNFTEVREQLSAEQTARAQLDEQHVEAVSELNALKSDHDRANRELSRLSATEDQTNMALTEAQANVGILTSELETAREGKAEAEAHLALAEEARSDLAAQLDSQKMFAAEKAEEAEAALAEARIANEARSVAEDAAHQAQAELKRTEQDARSEIEKALDKAQSAEAAAKRAQEAASEATDRVNKAEAAAAESKSAVIASALAAPSVLDDPVENKDSSLEVPPSETVSVDLAALPSPFVAVPDEVSEDDAAEDKTSENDVSEDAPAEADSETDRSKEEDASTDDGAEEQTPEAEAEKADQAETEDSTAENAFAWPPAPAPVESDTVIPASKPPTILSPPSPVLDSGPSFMDDEDDLDEVSELIAQTVSSFSTGDTMDNPVIQVEDSPTGLEATVTDGDAGGSALSGITSGPPSVFGGGPFQDRIDDDQSRRQPGRKRRQIEIPGDILEDEVAVAQFVVSSPDVVLLVDGDSVAKLGWPSYAVAQQRDALVTYLADLSASSGAAPDVVFDGRIGDDESLPASRAVRIRLSTPPTEPAAALDELVDAYPEQWPIALVTDDQDLAASAGERGAAVLNNGQLLDLFISE